jgi:hypothetical protein
MSDPQMLQIVVEGTGAMVTIAVKPIAPSLFEFDDFRDVHPLGHDAVSRTPELQHRRVLDQCWIDASHAFEVPEPSSPP